MPFSAKAQALIRQSFVNGDLLDVHTHCVGTGSHSDCEVNSLDQPRRLRSIPARIKNFVFLKSSGVTNIDNADVEYINRLKDIRLPAMFNHLLAFDKSYVESGTSDPKMTEIYTSNDWVFDQCMADDHLVPVFSVHPYRKDAVQELKRCSVLFDRWQAKFREAHDREVKVYKMIKWLPNAQNIDPAHAICAPFYEELKRLKFILLTHTGEERSLKGAHRDDFGHVSRLRQPLDMGVMVVAAHVSARGQMRFAMREMLAEEKYRANLFCDISAMLSSFAWMPGTHNPQITWALENASQPLLEGRLVFGSDYPVPAVKAVTNYALLSFTTGLIPREFVRPLREIRNANPLLADFVLKRVMRTPRTRRGFPVSIFRYNPRLAYP